MVKTRSYRHRSHRYHRRTPYVPYRPARRRSSILLPYLLMLVLLCLSLNWQPGLAHSVQAQTAQPPLFRIVAALGRAFRTAPLLSAAVPNQQGSQVVLNGQSYPVAWSRLQTGQIGVVDAGLIWKMGIDLLSTENAASQPIAWFSDAPSQPIALSAWQTGNYRYLDITELAQRFEWQVSVNGNTLTIATPTARVNGIRQEQLDWGDRLVVELDQTAPWQVSEQAGELMVTLDAQISPELSQAFRTRTTRQLQSLILAPKGNQTVLRLKVSQDIRPRVWSVANPHRLLIDLRPDSLVERNILWAPGVRWRQQWVSLGSARFPVVLLEVDPRQSGVRLKPMVSNAETVVGTAPLATTAQQYHAIAAINGGFFNRNNQLPLGAIRYNSRWFSGPILNRGAIGWNDQGEVAIDRLTLQETLVTNRGANLPVVHLNSGYVGKGIYRHTQEWGRTYTPILNHEQIVTVRNDQVVLHQRTQGAGHGAYPIPADGYLLVIRDDPAAVNALPTGSSIRLETAATPSEFNQFPHVLGAGPLLLHNQQIVLDALGEQFGEAFNQQFASRSVIATTSQGTLMLMTVHHRAGGRGPTLTETAQLAKQLGAVHALNLDGGSSTALYLGGQLLDRIPSTAAQVHNGIGVMIQ
ncbi:phosphodiester glycosidase family protein [Egbenema bharatensis]|uniref:phosphodiester glycosidase family protein n=1 Tax=Egbenema bharatensis TaxID=3463334 RepID=UPI003A889835